MLSKSYIARFTPILLARPITPKGIGSAKKHLKVLLDFGVSDLDIAVSLLGHCPGRPPKHGAIALTQSGVIFCHKTRLGGAIQRIQLSHISGFEVSKFIKQHVIKIYSSASHIEFVTRMAEKDVQSFISELNFKLENSTNSSVK